MAGWVVGLTGVPRVDTAEQHDEWTVASRRYLSAESLKAAQAFSIEEKEVVPELATAS